MGFNLKNIPLSDLLTMQQVIEFGSADISNLFFQAMEECKQNKISQRYFKELEDNLELRLSKNNDAVESVGSEILKRLKKIFPEISTTETMSYIRKAHKKEIEAYDALYKSEASKKESVKDVIKPVFKTSREKKV